MQKHVVLPNIRCIQCIYFITNALLPSSFYIYALKVEDSGEGEWE